MTGLWLASYFVLWGLVIVLCLFMIGILRQFGLMQHQLEQRQQEPQGEDSIPTLEYDGPSIGSHLMDLEADTINGFHTLTTTSLYDRDNTLLVFLSPMCETCQHIVEPLNALIEDTTHSLNTAVVMRADEYGCRAFLSVFPLAMPVVCDREATITMDFGIHRTPFGLLYDRQGTLIRKGTIEGHEDLQALLGDESASITAQENVFPQFVPSSV